MATGWRNRAREIGGPVPRTALLPLEVAESMRVGEQQVRDWIRDGTLRAFKVGVTYRVPLAELDRFYSEQMDHFAAQRGA